MEMGSVVNLFIDASRYVKATLAKNSGKLIFWITILTKSQLLFCRVLRTRSFQIEQRKLLRNV